MALLKQIETDYGVSANYWRVVNINTDILNRFAEVFLAGYVSHEARLDNKSPLPVRFPQTINLEEGQNYLTIAEVYEHMKTLPQFEGATDV